MSAECFVDTNMFLHWQPLDSIDWLSLTGSADVVITVCATVLRELDQKKQFDRSPRIRERAKDSIRRLEAWRTSLRLRDGVTLRLLADEPTVDWRSLDLSPDTPDDRILASAISKGFGATRKKYVVTGDFLMRLKAEARQLDVLTLPEEYRQPDVATEHEQEIRELTRRLSVYENREPRLTLEFGGMGADHTVRVDLPWPKVLTDPEIERLVAEMESSYQRQTADYERDLGRVPFFSRRDLDLYREAVPTYLQAYREHLQVERVWNLEAALAFRLPVYLRNAGYAPAIQARVKLHVEDGPTVYDPSTHDPFDEDQAPRPPQEPRSPLKILNVTNAHIPILGPALHSMIGSQFTGPRIRKTNSYELEYARPRIPHNEALALEPVVCGFRSPDKVKPFGVDYELHADNLIVPVSGRVVIVATCSGGPQQESTGH